MGIDQEPKPEEWTQIATPDEVNTVWSSLFFPPIALAFYSSPKQSIWVRTECTKVLNAFFTYFVIVIPVWLIFFGIAALIDNPFSSVIIMLPSFLAFGYWITLVVMIYGNRRNIRRGRPTDYFLKSLNLFKIK